MRLLAARLVAIGLALVAGVLMLMALGVWLHGGLDHSASPRFWTSLVLGGVSALSWRVGQRHPTLALALMFAAIILALGQAAVALGLGVHMLMLAGGGILMALSGPTLGMRATFALAALYLTVVAGLAWAEAEQLIAGASAPTANSVPARILGHILVCVSGVLAAAMLARVVSGALTRTALDQQRIAELLAIGSDWTWELDARGNFSFLSPSFEARSGRTVAEFLKVNQPGGPQVVAGADWDRVLGHLRERTPYRDMPSTYRCLDGTLLHVVASGSPVFDAAGHFTGWRGLSRNVTAMRVAEEEKRRTKQMLDSLVDTSPDAICVARLADGRIQWANPGFTRYSGYSRDEVAGRSAFELGLWPERAEAYRFRKALRRSQGRLLEFRSHVMMRDGGRREVLLSAAAFDLDGHPAAVITTRDITEMERARRETDAILDNASVGIALVRRHRFERVNPALELMLGHAPRTLQGLSTSVLFADAAQFRAFINRSNRLINAGETADIERNVLRADGQTRRLHMRASPVDRRNPDAGAIWVLEDVTTQRQSERDLAQAKSLAEAASQAKSAFLATMSHEIRTPLNGVLGLARLLQDAQLQPAQRADYLGHLVGSAELLAGIVSDVLDLSKIEAGHLQLEDIDFDLHELLRTAFHAFAALGTERGLTMTCRIADDVPRHLRGDPLRLRQIVANYLGNALKFTERGSITLVAECDATRLRISVVDTGPGIAPEVQERLFKPFAQGDSSTTRRFGGTGLGLSICRQLAVLMHGDTGLTASGDSGSHFWVELPLVAAQGGPAQPAATPDESHPLKGLTALVAEDNAVNMLIISAMLERRGARVLQAADGQEAVDLALRHADAVHVVLMDLHMPTLDGLAATRALRADARTAALPVFAFSAAVLAHERREAEASGMQGFIAKPVVEEELLRVLRPLAEAARQGTGAATTDAALGNGNGNANGDGTGIGIGIGTGIGYTHTTHGAPDAASAAQLSAAKAAETA